MTVRLQKLSTVGRHHGGKNRSGSAAFSKCIHQLYVHMCPANNIIYCQNITLYMVDVDEVIANNRSVLLISLQYFLIGLCATVQNVALICFLLIKLMIFVCTVQLPGGNQINCGDRCQRLGVDYLFRSIVRKNHLWIGI